MTCAAVSIPGGANAARVKIYFDFLCPFAWRGLELMDKLEMRPQLVHFSLVQGNHPDNKDRRNPTWKLAERPLDEGTDAQKGSLAAFLAAQAARAQGDEAERRFSLELFRQRFVEKADLADPATARAAAEKAGLDLARFEADLADEAARRATLAADLEDASALAVFGTPTFQLDSGEAAYFRFASLPETREDAEAAWRLYTDVLRSGASIETIKRPR